MKNILKKYWFVILIGVLLVAGVIFYTTGLSNSGEFDTLKGKTVNNQDVLYSFNGEDTTADAFYDELYDSYGEDAVAKLFIREVTDQTIETTEEMQTEADTNAENVKIQFQENYGDDADSTLLQALQQYGYDSVDDLTQFFIDEAKSLSLMTTFVTETKKEVFEAYIAEKNPRIVSHILVQMVDPENPTEEEAAKLAEAKQSLIDGTAFEEAAYTYSDDGSAETYGLLGFMDADTAYVPEFLDAALNTEAGQTSEWFKSDYGYHIIYVNSTDVNDFIPESGFSTALSTFDETMNGSVYSEAIWAAAQDLNVTFSSDELEASLKESFGMGGTE
jgi:foldase protein PrsA